MFRSLALAAALVVLASCGACEDPPPPPPPPVVEAPKPPPPPEPVKPPEPEVGAVVVSRVGAVEIRRGDAAAWSEVKVGDRLRADDALRTEQGGEVEISVSDVTVRIQERSEFKVKTVTQTALRARMKGRIESNVQQGKGTLELEADGSDAVVKSEGGKFTMSASGAGVVAVATESGQVNLFADGTSVDVNEGEWSQALPGKKPQKSSPALKKMMLALRWPSDRETNKRTLPVSGKVQAGTRVTLQGQPVEVDKDGKFSTKLQLKQGRQRVVLVATDIHGRVKEEDVQILMDETLPDTKVKEVDWGSR